MTPRTIASQLLDEAGNDPVEARKRIALALQKPEVRAAMDAFDHDVLADAINDQWREQRASYRISQRIEREPTFRVLAKGETSRSPMVQAVVAMADKPLMDWPLSASSGRVLGDATKAELREWLDQKRKRVETEVFDMTFVERVDALLPNPHDKVRDVLREADLQRERKRAAQKLSGDTEKRKSVPGARGSVQRSETEIRPGA